MKRPTFALRLLLLATVVGGAQSASAQLASSRSGSSTMQYIEGEEAMATLIRFGRCYAMEETEKALQLLATSPTSIEERRTYISLFRRSDEYCLGDVSSLSADVPSVRGAIAEGLYTQGVAVPPAMMQTIPELADVANLSGAARCYVGSHIGEVRRLLAETKPGTRKEYEEVEKLLPDFFKCVPAGARLTFSATVIRFRLAEALLRTAGPEAQVN